MNSNMTASDLKRSLLERKERQEARLKMLQDAGVTDFRIKNIQMDIKASEARLKRLETCVQIVSGKYRG